MHHWMYFLHAINSDRQKRLPNVLGQIAMILRDKKKSDYVSVLYNSEGSPTDYAVTFTSISL